jgi:hypothetical protein
MKNLSLFFLFFALAVSACRDSKMVEPETSGSDHNVLRLGSDTIRTGSYSGFAIGEGAESAYTTVRTLQTTKGVTFLNVVSNVFTDLTGLQGRIPLYQAIHLDEARGTDQGVQFSFKGGKVESIYLNSGRKLNQWPVGFVAPSAVVMGDQAEIIYDKLLKIRDSELYKKKFERINLLTKDISTAYDTGMSLSPQWYFTHWTGIKEMDEIQLHLREGKVNFIVVNHFRYLDVR